MDNFLQISITDNFFSLYNVSAAHAVASDAFDNPLGLPPRRPRARAALNPACVHSRITSRSNSARDAKILKINHPCGLCVSIGSFKLHKPIFFSSNCCSSSIKFLSDRPRRSNFQITSTSSGRSWLIKLFKMRRSTLTPLTFSSYIF